MPLDYLKPILTGLGVADAKAAELLAIPEDKQKDVKPEDYIKEALGAVQTKLKNDPEFLGSISEDVLPETVIKSIEGKQYGKAATMLRQHLTKGMGLKEEDFADLGEEGKKIQVYVKRAVEKFVAGKSTDEQLQAQLIQARKDLEAAQEEHPRKLAELETKYKGEKEATVFDFIVLAHLASFKNLKVPTAYVIDKLTKQLRGEYAFEVNGMDANLKQKNNPKLDVIVGTEKLTLQKAIEKILTDDKLLDEDKKPPKETGSVTLDIKPTNGKLEVSSHIADAIKRNIELEKKAAGE